MSMPAAIASGREDDKLYVEIARSMRPQAQPPSLIFGVFFPISGSIGAGYVNFLFDVLRRGPHRQYLINQDTEWRSSQRHDGERNNNQNRQNNRYKLVAGAELHRCFLLSP